MAVAPDSVRRYGKGIAALVAMLVGILFLFNVFETVNANEILLVQSVGGKMTWHVTPGVKWQGFGKLTTYPKRHMYEFACLKWQENETTKQRDCVPEEDQRIKLRFNDGGHAYMSGSIQYEMPLDNKSIYMIGPLMSSKESYAEKRNALISLVEDQVLNGVVKTIQKDVKTKDPLTGVEKTVTIVEIVNGRDGNHERQEPGQLTAFGIRPFNFSIKDMPYDDVVEKQIQQQQQLTMQVQTAIAEARQAEQRAITVAKEGEANAAKAKWEQEVIKAKEVTAAEQRLAVAELDRRAAAKTKAANILLGEGEARRRQLVMEADGALDKKLAAYIETQKYWADAVKNYQGNWMPLVSSGGGAGSQAGSGAMQLLEIMGSKAAIDLGLDLKASGAGRTTKK